MQSYKSIRFSERLDYSFAIGRVRALEAYFLDRQWYERLIRTKDAQQFLATVFESRYSQFFDELSRFNPPLIFTRAQEENLRFCLQYAAEEWLEALLRLPAEVYNLKVVLKQALKEEVGLGEKWELPVMRGDFARGRKWQEIIALINKEGAEAFSLAQERSDPSLIDIYLDRLEQRLALQLSSGQDYAFGYYRLFADLKNLVTALRVRLLGEDERVLAEALLPGGRLPAKTVLELVKVDEETLDTLLSSIGRYAPLIRIGLKSVKEKGSLVLMEREVRQTLLDYINLARYVALGYEPLLRFYRLWENELTNLRLLYAAKLAGLGAEECQDLVVYGF
ncbi:MAG: V-type ATPase subunit [candidate division WOR-3 bacterium]